MPDCTSIWDVFSLLCSCFSVEEDSLVLQHWKSTSHSAGLDTQHNWQVVLNSRQARLQYFTKLQLI